MISLFRSLLSRPAAVEFCDRCGSVCDAACRARQRREAQRVHALQALGTRR